MAKDRLENVRGHVYYDGIRRRSPFALFEFDKIQFTGVLNESGDRMELTALVTLFDADGNQLPPKEGIRDKANGIRIPLEVLPSTSHTLPIPAIPQPRPSSGWPDQGG
jgi:hypothetical protein